VAEGGAERLRERNAVASDGSDRLKQNQVAEGGAERLRERNQVAEGGSDRLRQNRSLADSGYDFDMSADAQSSFCYACR